MSSLVSSGRGILACAHARATAGGSQRLRGVVRPARDAAALTAGRSLPTASCALLLLPQTSLFRQNPCGRRSGAPQAFGVRWRHTVRRRGPPLDGVAPCPQFRCLCGCLPRSVCFVRNLVDAVQGHLRPSKAFATACRKRPTGTSAPCPLLPAACSAVSLHPYCSRSRQRSQGQESASTSTCSGCITDVR